MQWNKAYQGLVAKLSTEGQISYNNFKHTPIGSEEKARNHLQHHDPQIRNVHKQFAFADSTLRWVFVTEDGIL